MTFIAINVLTVPEGGGEVLEQRFGARKGSVDTAPGFLSFELLRPVSGTDDYLVLTRWATRTLPSEQHARPLPTYAIGPRFLASLDKLEGIKDEKVADVVVEIVTGLAPQIPGREVHHLRSGPGGDDPVRVRVDGAVAWRASLQVKSPSARRIHYWVLSAGGIELARVTTHDDFDA